MKKLLTYDLCGEFVCADCGGCACDDKLCSCDLTGGAKDDE